jgi:hypothetical protein
MYKLVVGSIILVLVTLGWGDHGVWAQVPAPQGGVRSTKIEPKDYVAFIGILATLLLGLYNAVQNYRNSKRTTFINTVTSERVKWIEKLRRSISTFCGLAHYWRFSTVKGSDDEREKLEEIDKLRHLIALQLNPHGAIDKEIQKLVGDIVSMSSGYCQVSDDDYRRHLETLTEKTQQLLKAEWEKVKEESIRGDLSRKGVD